VRPKAGAEVAIGFTELGTAAGVAAVQLSAGENVQQLLQPKPLHVQPVDAMAVAATCAAAAGTATGVAVMQPAAG